jgi:AP-3 complex subunit delta-1
MVHVSGVSREKRRERGQGRVEVGVVERMSGAFWERARAVGGGIEAGGVRRLACVMVAIVSEIW